MEEPKNNIIIIQNNTGNTPPKTGVQEEVKEPQQSENYTDHFTDHYTEPDGSVVGERKDEMDKEAIFNSFVASKSNRGTMRDKSYFGGNEGVVNDEILQDSEFAQQLENEDLKQEEADGLGTGGSAFQRDNTLLRQAISNPISHNPGGDPQVRTNQLSSGVDPYISGHGSLPPSSRVSANQESSRHNLSPEGELGASALPRKNFNLAIQNITGIPSGLGLTDGGETTKYKYKGSLNEEAANQNMENSDSVLNQYRELNSGTADKLSQMQMNQKRDFQQQISGGGTSDFINDINVGINDLEKGTVANNMGALRHLPTNSEAIPLDQNFSSTQYHLVQAQEGNGRKARQNFHENVSLFNNRGEFSINPTSNLGVNSVIGNNSGELNFHLEQSSPLNVPNYQIQVSSPSIAQHPDHPTFTHSSVREGRQVEMGQSREFEKLVHEGSVSNSGHSKSFSRSPQGSQKTLKSRRPSQHRPQNQQSKRMQSNKKALGDRKQSLKIKNKFSQIQIHNQIVKSNRHSNTRKRELETIISGIQGGLSPNVDNPTLNYELQTVTGNRHQATMEAQEVAAELSHSITPTSSHQQNNHTPVVEMQTPERGLPKIYSTIDPKLIIDDGSRKHKQKRFSSIPRGKTDLQQMNHLSVISKKKASLPAALGARASRGGLDKSRNGQLSRNQDIFDHSLVLKPTDYSGSTPATLQHIKPQVHRRAQSNVRGIHHTSARGGADSLYNSRLDGALPGHSGNDSSLIGLPLAYQPLAVGYSEQPSLFDRKFIKPKHFSLATDMKNPNMNSQSTAINMASPQNASSQQGTQKGSYYNGLSPAKQWKRSQNASHLSSQASIPEQRIIRRVPNSKSVDDLLAENKELKAQVMVEIENQYGRLTDFSLNRKHYLRDRKHLFDHQQERRIQGRQKIEAKKDHIREEIHSMRSKIVYLEDKNRLIYYENLLAQKMKSADLVFEKNVQLGQHGNRVEHQSTKIKRKVLAGEEQRLIYENQVRHLKNEIDRERKQNSRANRQLREQHRQIIGEERELRELACLIKETKEKLKDDPNYLETKKKQEEEVPEAKFEVITKAMEDDRKEIEALSKEKKSAELKFEQEAKTLTDDIAALEAEIEALSKLEKQFSLHDFLLADVEKEANRFVSDQHDAMSSRASRSMTPAKEKYQIDARGRRREISVASVDLSASARSRNRTHSTSPDRTSKKMSARSHHSSSSPQRRLPTHQPLPSKAFNNSSFRQLKAIQELPDTLVDKLRSSVGHSRTWAKGQQKQSSISQSQITEKRIESELEEINKLKSEQAYLKQKIQELQDVDSRQQQFQPKLQPIAEHLELLLPE